MSPFFDVRKESVNDCKGTGAAGPAVRDVSRGAPTRPVRAWLPYSWRVLAGRGRARQGSTWLDWTRRGRAGTRLGRAWLPHSGLSLLGPVRARRGKTGPDVAGRDGTGPDKAWLPYLGAARQDLATQCTARQGRTGRGATRRVLAGHDMAGLGAAWLGATWLPYHGESRQGRGESVPVGAGLVGARHRPGAAGLGKAGQDTARRGKAGLPYSWRGEVGHGAVRHWRGKSRPVEARLGKAGHGSQLHNAPISGAQPKGENP